MENGNTNPNMILDKVDKMILRKEYDRAKKILSDFINTYTSKYKEDDTFINNSMNSDIALRILNSFRAVNNKVS